MPKRPRRSKGAALSEDMYDDVDAFHRQREQVRLQAVGGESDGSDDVVEEDGGMEDVFGAKYDKRKASFKTKNKKGQRNSFYASSSDSSEGDTSSDSGGTGSGSSDDDSDADDDNYGMRAPAPLEDEESDHEDLFQTDSSGNRSRGNDDDVTSGWGKKARAFYGQDEIDSDDETAGLRGAALAAARKKQLSKDPEARQHKLQEREALRLQKISRQGMTAADFGLGSSDDDDAADTGSDSDSGTGKAKAKRGQKNGKSKIRKKKKSGRSSKNSDKAGGASSSSSSSSSLDSDSNEEEEIISRDHSSLSTEEKLSIVVKDSPELLGILEELKTKSSELQKKVRPILTKVRPPSEQDGVGGDAESSDETYLPTSAGVSFLEVKLHLLLNYIINVGFYLVLKAAGKPVRDHPVINHLVELRVVMEKIRPLEGKLKYQIDKLLRQASSGDLGANGKDVDDDVDMAQNGDALAFRPNLAGMVKRMNGNSDSSSSNKGRTKRGEGYAPASSSGYAKHDLDHDAAGSDIYRAPKRAAAMYDEYAGNASAGQRAKAERDAARVKKQLAKSKMLKELQAEFTDRPEEVEDAFRGAGGDAELARENAERQAYEEEYMTRLTLTKKDKQRRKRALQGSSGNVLDNRAGNGLHDIEDYEALDELINMNAEASGMGGAAAFEDQMRFEKSKRRQKELRKFEQQQRNGAKRISGDADVEYRDPADVARRAQERASRYRGGDDDVESANFGGGEGLTSSGVAAAEAHTGREVQGDSFYERAKSADRDRKRKRKEQYDWGAQLHAEGGDRAFTEEDFEGEGGKRGATYQMLKNQGLKAHKKRVDRNPRVKKRRQYEKAKKNRKGAVRAIRTGEEGRYAGESTGIRTTISRSRRLG